MAQLPPIQLHWTASRQGLVLSGAPNDIQSIARCIAVPSEETVRSVPGRASLAIWGDALSRFERAYGHEDDTY